MSKLGFFPDTWMGRGVCTPTGGGLTDTFLMSRRHTVWPVLNTAETGTWAWSGDAGKMFGGCYTNTSNTENDSISFDNLNLFSAGAAINLLYTKASTGGVAKIYWGTKGSAPDLLGTIDMYAASTQKNQVAQFSLGTVTKSRKTLHIVMETAGTGGGYTCQIQQAEVVQLTGSNLGTSIDDLPWWVDVPPFATNSTAGQYSVYLEQNASYTWGTRAWLSAVQNDFVEYDVGVAPGTYTFSAIFTRSTDRPIMTVAVNGVTGGTIDMYGTTQNNTKGSISGLTISSAGVKQVRLTAATQNGSSTGYYCRGANWLQFRKTAAHGAITPTGATYGRETLELWPWFADTSDFDTFALSSNYLHYGYFYNSGAVQNDEMIFAHELLPGAFSGLSVHRQVASTYGVVHVSENGGSDLDTFDCGASPNEFNHREPFTADLVGGNLRFGVDSKTGSTYFYGPTMVHLTRTGA